MARHQRRRPMIPPSNTARRYAEMVESRAYLASMPPDGIVDDTAGCIAVYWCGTEVIDDGTHKRYGCLECGNDGSVVAIVGNWRGSVSDVWEVEVSYGGVDAALGRIMEFLASEREDKPVDLEASH